MLTSRVFHHCAFLACGSIGSHAFSLVSARSVLVPLLVYTYTSTRSIRWARASVALQLARLPLVS